MSANSKCVSLSPLFLPYGSLPVRDSRAKPGVACPTTWKENNTRHDIRARRIKPMQIFRLGNWKEAINQHFWRPAEREMHCVGRELANTIITRWLPALAVLDKYWIETHRSPKLNLHPADNAICMQSAAWGLRCLCAQCGVHLLRGSAEILHSRV